MYDPNVLYHHGVLGQKWGVRHYQNKDGSYNSAGKKRYGVGDGKPYHSVAGNAKRASAKIYELNEKTYKKLGNKALASMNAAAKNKALKEAAEADKAGAKKKAANAKQKEINKQQRKEAFNKWSDNLREKNQKAYEFAKKQPEHYDYKNSKEYKKGSKSQRLAMAARHAGAKMLLGPSAANKLDHDSIKNGENYSKNFSKKLISDVTIGMTVAAGATAIKYAVYHKKTGGSFSDMTAKNVDRFKNTYANGYFAKH